MKNKTIFDAVNELQGVWNFNSEFICATSGSNTAYSNNTIRPSTGVNVNHYHYHICSIGEFNALVEEMKNNFGKCLDYQYIAYQLAAKQLLEPIKQASNTYTQEMFDNGVFPSVGMECLVSNRKVDNSTFEKATILFIGKFVVVYNSESCTERVGDMDSTGYITFKPLTPPVPLTDGRAYQFELGGSIRVGFYVLARDSFMDRTVSGNKICGKGEPTNIQPLTLD